MRLNVLVLIGCVSLVSHLGLSSDTFAKSPAIRAVGKRALVYKGPGACDDGCWEAAFQMAKDAGLSPVYVEPDALKDNNRKSKEELFKDAVIWIQPGGKSSTAIKAMTPALKKAIIEFVNNGGGYVGFCAGAFASTTIIGSTMNVGLSIMPGRTTMYPIPDVPTIVKINWNGKIRDIYWEGGPYLSEIPDGKAEVMARYEDGAIASARTHFGKGRVYVTGLHPEAPKWWSTSSGILDTDGDDHDLALEMINWVIRR